MPPETAPGAHNDTGESVGTSVAPAHGYEMFPSDGWLSCSACPNWWMEAWLGPTCRTCGGPGLVVPKLPSSEELWAVGIASLDKLFSKKPPPPPRPVGVVSTNKAVTARLKGLLRNLRATPVGERNTRLHWAACRVAEMLVDGDLPDAARAAEALSMVALEIGLDPGEVGGTIDSGFGTYGVIA